MPQWIPLYFLHQQILQQQQLQLQLQQQQQQQQLQGQTLPCSNYQYEETSLEQLIPSSSLEMSQHAFNSGETMLKPIQPEDLFGNEKTTSRRNLSATGSTRYLEQHVAFNLQHMFNSGHTAATCDGSNMLQGSSNDVTAFNTHQNTKQLNNNEKTSTATQTTIVDSNSSSTASSPSPSTNKSNSSGIGINTNKNQRVDVDCNLPLYSSLIQKKRGRPPKVNFKVEFSEHAYSMIYNGKVEEAIKVESVSSRRGKSRVLKSIPKHVLQSTSSSSVSGYSSSVEHEEE